jgi:hypothetical protein
VADVNLIVIILLLLLIFGAFGGIHTGYVPAAYGWPGGGLGVVLLIVVILLLVR